MSPARSVEMRVARFADENVRAVGTDPSHLCVSNADADPRLSGELLSGTLLIVGSGIPGLKPSVGRVAHVVDSVQESSGRKIARCAGSPSNAYPVKLVRPRLADVTTAPDGIEERSNFSSPSDGPVPQPYDLAPP